MLDLTSIPVVDNHCHPMLLEQRMDAVQFRSHFSEATHPDFAHKHLPNTVYYLWLLRQLATFYACPSNEQDIIAARTNMSADDLLRSLLQSAHIDTLILDSAYPPPPTCYSAQRISQLAQCRTVELLRLETLMQRLILAHDDFDDVIALFSAAVSNIRADGYCGLKSIVAYRTGLRIAQWPKDAAATAFNEARVEAVRTGQLRIAHKPLIDYLLHIAFALASEQQIPVQFHTGYGDSDTDMRLGNPLHLRDILQRPDYQGMQVVLLHESYPYCQLGAYLAAIYPHVYFDLSYTIPFVDQLEMLTFTRQALSIAPASKLMYSSDGINVPEMHWVGALRGRMLIAQTLQTMLDANELDEPQAYQLAHCILHDTAYNVYKL